MAHRIERLHPSCHQQQAARCRQQQVKCPEPFGHHTDLGVDLVVVHPRRLCRKQHLVSQSEDGQEGYREENNPQATNPLSETTPEQHAVGKRLDVIQNRSPRSGKARHRLEKGICHRRNLTAQQHGQHPEHRKQHPREGHDAIPVASGNTVVAAFPQKLEQKSDRHRRQGRIAETLVSRFPVSQRHTHAYQKHHPFQVKQDA